MIDQIVDNKHFSLYTARDFNWRHFFIDETTELVMKQ